MFGLKIPKFSEMKEMTPKEKKEYVDEIIQENIQKIEEARGE